MNRKPLSKKLRFEVFKRDGFACQYCGATPPAVVLECDHIEPVTAGGSDDEGNLVTACFDCNRGKAARLLSVAPESLAARAARVAEAEEQLAGYRAVMRAVQERKEADVWEVIGALFGEAETTHARFQSVARFLEKLPLDEPRKDSPKIGDLALAKPSPPPSPAPPPQPTATPQPAPLNPNVGDAGDAAAAVPVQRPRTLAEAKARMDGGMLIGEKMKQDGGVQRRGSIALDVRGSPFGAYDGKIIAAIQQAWYHLLADRLTPIGKVVIEFHLHANGRVSHLTLAGSEVGELYGQMCALAVQRPAPFDPWPREMRLALGADYREVRFTFFYE